MMNDKELNEAIAAMAYPKVTPEMVEGAIEQAEYFRSGKLTVCVVTLRNGFKVTGESACVDPRNFNEDIGAALARKAAVEKVWVLEGYALAERIRMAAEAQRAKLDTSRDRNR